MTFLIYGATGYTGELIARRAVEQGLRPTVAGRTARSVERLAADLDLPSRVASVDDAAALRAAVHGHQAVLNCAGPFSRTADAVAEACLAERAHYLDITGEMMVFEAMAGRDARAARAGVMLLPGVGFDVVPSDCLAAHVAHHLPDATSLTISIRTSGGGGMSRGTALTALEGLGTGGGTGAVRRGGRIVSVPPAWKTRRVDFGRGPVPVTTMPWGDVASAYYSTGIREIEVYMAIPAALRQVLRWGRPLLPLVTSAPVRRWLERRVRRGAPGPDAAQRARGHSHFRAEVRDAAGRSASALLHTPEGYELTVRTALESMARTLRGEGRPGFQTPSRAFGADLVLAIHGVERSEVVLG